MSQMEAIQLGAWKIVVEGKRVASLLPDASFGKAAREILRYTGKATIEQRHDGSIVWQGQGCRVVFR